MRLRKAFLVVSLALLVAPSASAVTIGFDALEVANDAINLIAPGVYTEGDFTITGDPMNYMGQLSSRYAGSAGLTMGATGASATLELSLAGSCFDIFSIDLSFIEPDALSAASVEFLGTQSDGTIVSQTFQPTAFGFQTFAFDASFQDLLTVVWVQNSLNSQTGHQFDNIVVNAGNPIPEPSAARLFGIGLPILATRLRRR